MTLPKEPLIKRPAHCLNQRFGVFLTAMSLVIGLSACSHGPVVQEYPATASATEELSKLTTDVQSAVKTQVDVLAPKAFYEAKKGL